MISTGKTQLRDVASIIIAVLLFGLLITFSFLVLQPFLPALTWAAMIVISSWKLMLMIQARLRGSRGLAVAVMTLILTLVLILPLTIAFIAITENIGFATEQIKKLSADGISEPPVWVETIPVVGSGLAKRWHDAAHIGRDEVLVRIKPFLGRAAHWFVGQVGGLGLIVVHFLLTIIIAAILYARGEAAARGIISFARRLGDDRGEQAVILAAQAIKAVASGVVITALVQALLATIGMVIAGIPYALILGCIAFLLCVVQLGVWPILIGADIWLFYSDSTVTAWVFLGWTVFVLGIDNVLRPFLIKRGADLPLLLIFAGVIGGLISFGIIGIFIGPVVLAVTYTLLQIWLTVTEQPETAA